MREIEYISVQHSFYGFLKLFSMEKLLSRILVMTDYINGPSIRPGGKL